MNKEFDRKLILEEGTEYLGYGFGATGDRVLEIVFNTSMTGYQEILSDPSYTDQAVVMTYPLASKATGVSLCSTKSIFLLTCFFTNFTIRYQLIKKNRSRVVPV